MMPRKESKSRGDEAASEETPSRPVAVTRRSGRKSCLVERLQIHHSSTAQTTSLVQKKMSQPTDSPFASAIDQTSDPTSKESVRVRNIPPPNNHTINLLNKTTTSTPVHGDNGCSIIANGGSSRPVPQYIERDIQEIDFSELENDMNRNSQFVLTVVNPQRKYVMDSELFTNSMNNAPWKEQGDIVFYCEQGKLVKCHSVLLQTILPEFVADLQEYHRRHYGCSTALGTSPLPRISVFCKGVHWHVLQCFLILINRGVIFMPGRQISALKKLLEVLNIQEVSIQAKRSRGHSNSNTEAFQGNSSTNSCTHEELGTQTAFPVPTGCNPTASTTLEQVSLSNSSVSGLLVPHPLQTKAGEKVEETPVIENRTAHTAAAPRAGVQRKSTVKLPTSVVEEVIKAISELSKSRPGREAEPDGSRTKSANAVEASSVRQDARQEHDLSLELSASTSGPNLLGGDVKKTDVETPRGTRLRSGRVKAANSEKGTEKGGKRKQETNESGKNVTEEMDKKRSRMNYSKELRDNVLKALMNGEMIADVAKRHNLTSTVVSRWKYTEKKKSSGLFSPASATTTPKTQEPPQDMENAYELLKGITPGSSASMPVTTSVTTPKSPTHPQSTSLETPNPSPSVKLQLPVTSSEVTALSYRPSDRPKSSYELGQLGDSSAFFPDSYTEPQNLTALYSNPYIESGVSVYQHQGLWQPQPQQDPLTVDGKGERKGQADDQNIPLNMMGPSISVNVFGEIGREGGGQCVDVHT